MGERWMFSVGAQPHLSFHQAGSQWGFQKSKRERCTSQAFVGLGDCEHILRFSVTRKPARTESHLGKASVLAVARPGAALKKADHE